MNCIPKEDIMKVYRLTVWVEAGNDSEAVVNFQQVLYDTSADTEEIRLLMDEGEEI